MPDAQDIQDRNIQDRNIQDRNIQEMLIAPIEDEAHHQQVCESLEYARRVGDHPAIVILLAQFAHSKSWRPEPVQTEKEGLKP